MTDIEILLFAAKAAGLKHVDYDGINYDGSLGIQLVDGIGRHTDSWNPLEDDGDALRLAVKLGIEWRRARKSRSTGRVIKVWFSHDGNPRRSASMCISEQVNGSTIAATRRAIVRAAAAIGLNMVEVLGQEKTA